MFGSYPVMTYNYATNSVAKNPKKMYQNKNILNEFTSTYYDDKNHYFAMLFRQYTTSSINNIYHPSLIELCKSYTDKEDYEYNLHKSV